MNQGRRILALIPARGGSKGIPGKNIKPFCGKPLIAWTIEAAAASALIDRVIVSTDDPEIRRTALEYGAEAPFPRPPEIAGDDAVALDVVRHAVRWVERQGDSFQLLMYLQPTSPLRRVEDIDGCIRFFFEKDAVSVVGVCRVEAPYLSGTLGDDMSMKDFASVGHVNRQQIRGNYYRINGALYLSRWAHLKENGDWYGEGSFAYVMPRERSIDIDDPLDFRIAECLHHRNGVTTEFFPH